MDIDKVNLIRAWVSAFAEMFDYFRVVPRFVLFLYIWYVYDVSKWFMSLQSPDTQHAAFIGTVVGAAAVIIGLYQKSGKDWGSQGFRDWPFPEKQIVPVKEEADKTKK